MKTNKFECIPIRANLQVLGDWRVTLDVRTDNSTHYASCTIDTETGECSSYGKYAHTPGQKACVEAISAGFVKQCNKTWEEFIRKHNLASHKATSMRVTCNNRGKIILIEENFSGN